MYYTQTSQKTPNIINMSSHPPVRKVEADGELTSFNAVKMHGKEVKRTEIC